MTTAPSTSHDFAINYGGSPIRPTAGFLPATWRRLSRLRASVLVKECRLLWRMRESKLFHLHGYRNLGDFAQEVLRITPRTARRRLTVARAMVSDPQVEQALLSGRLSLCQVEALAPVIGRQPLASWLAAADSHSIRELRHRVRKTSPPDHRPDPDVLLAIQAPVTAAAAFDHALHTAQHVLGWDAPRSVCFEAILAEADSSLGHPGIPPNPAARAVVGRPGTPAPASQLSHPPKLRPASHSLPASLRDFLQALDQELSDLEALLKDDAADPVVQFRLLEQSLRPVTLFQGKFLHHIRNALTPQHFNQNTWEQVAEQTFRTSIRNFRDLIRDAKFLQQRDMENAYVQGEVTLGHLRLISRLKVFGGGLQTWLTRAKRVPFRQFAREIGLAENLNHLREALAWPRDPAMDPRVLETKEREVHARLMRNFPSGVGRQALSHIGPVTTITFRISRGLQRQWARLRFAVQALMQQTAPAWVCLLQLAHLALEEWTRTESKPRTLAQRIVERDDYHCTAPGCSQRRHLEAHHIEFRSRGGSDHAQNLTTLCAFHHRFGVHGNITRLTGRARDRLHWRFPRARFLGQLRLA